MNADGVSYSVTAVCKLCNARYTPSIRKLTYTHNTAPSSSPPRVDFSNLCSAIPTVQPPSDNRVPLIIIGVVGAGALITIVWMAIHLLRYKKRQQASPKKLKPIDFKSVAGVSTYNDQTAIMGSPLRPNSKKNDDGKIELISESNLKPSTPLRSPSKVNGSEQELGKAGELISPFRTIVDKKQKIFKKKPVGDPQTPI